VVVELVEVLLKQQLALVRVVLVVVVMVEVVFSQVGLGLPIKDLQVAQYLRVEQAVAVVELAVLVVLEQVALESQQQ
jgi:hypothetical protein